MKCRLIGFVALFGGSAGCVADPAVEATGSAIVGGQVEEGFAAVGAINTNLGACTATLIAPRVALSAKHCIGANATPESVELRTGVNAETSAARGAQLYFLGAVDDFQPDGTLAQDFLVVRLDRDVPVEPAPVRRAAMGDGEVGAAVLHVGYGVTSEQARDNGVRRSGGGTIDGVQGGTFTTSRGGAATVCFGDSGGPVFLDGEIAGIANGTYQPFCTDRAIHARVDQYAALIDQALADAGGPGDGGGGPGDGGGGPGDGGGGPGDGGGGPGDGGGGPGDGGGGPGVCEDYEYNCDDGRDDDCDGLVDCDDPACFSSCGIAEDDGASGGDAGDPGADDDPGVCEEYEWDCDDGADDDCNGLTDCDDPACETSC